MKNQSFQNDRQRFWACHINYFEQTMYFIFISSSGDICQKKKKLITK